jgi:hypothetical protein
MASVRMMGVVRSRVRIPVTRNKAQRHLFTKLQARACLP